MIENTIQMETLKQGRKKKLKNEIYKEEELHTNKLIKLPSKNIKMLLENIKNGRRNDKNERYNIQEM
jgi:hypothetical protein